LRIFNFLWRVKHVEHALSSIAKNHMTVNRRLFKMKQVRGALLKCHILHSEMNHFLYNFLNYLMVDVIESAWKTFLHKLETVSNMNELIKIH